MTNQPTTPRATTTGELPPLPKSPPDARTGLDYWKEKAYWEAANRRHNQNGRPK